MAQMFPSTIRYKRSPAEVRLFRTFETSLDDAWIVLHHVRWLEKLSGRAAKESEADFVLAHPAHGAIVLEVKGGEVSFDAGTGEWTSRSKDGTTSTIKDPFDQAKDACYGLQRHLKSIPRWPQRWGPIGYAVCFPDGTLRSRPLPHMEPALIDTDVLAAPDELGAKLAEICDFWRRDHHDAGEDGIRVLLETFAHDVRIEHPLRLDIEDADRGILELSDEQFRVLDILDGEPRVAVSGPAGSGKTVLAAEKARRLAAHGFEVLLTCFNRPLADHIRAGLADVEGVQTAGFHQLCFGLCKEAGVATPGDRDSREFWDEQLPAFLAEAIDVVGPRFDALIVDEAQDFAEGWWLPLQMLLRDPDHGILYVFFDDNQAIYGRPAGLPDGLVTARIPEVWRNTSPIFDSVMTFYQGSDVTCRGPQGPEIEMISVTADSMKSELSKLLHRLITEGDLRPRDVAVLTPHAAPHSPLRGKVGSFQLVDEPSAKNDIRLASIYRYKGLDAPAVVLCDIDRYVEEEFKKLMYVGCSRARAYLAVLLTEHPGGHGFDAS
jgi:hypothetical protein